MKYSKNGQKFAMSKNASDVLFGTCWTLCKKPHVSKWSRSRYTFFWMTRYQMRLLHQDLFYWLWCHLMTFYPYLLFENNTGQTDGQTDGRTERLTDERTDGRTETTSAYSHLKKKPLLMKLKLSGDFRILCSIPPLIHEGCSFVRSLTTLVEELKIHLSYLSRWSWCKNFSLVNTILQ